MPIAVDANDHVLYFDRDEVWCRFCQEVVPITREVTMDDVIELRKKEFYVTAADAWIQLNGNDVR